MSNLLQGLHSLFICRVSIHFLYKSNIWRWKHVLSELFDTKPCRIIWKLCQQVIVESETCDWIKFKSRTHENIWLDTSGAAARSIMAKHHGSLEKHHGKALWLSPICQAERVSYWQSAEVSESERHIPRRAGIRCGQLPDASIAKILWRSMQ